MKTYKVTIYPSGFFNKTPPRSNQDMFNRVWTHFVIDGRPRCVVRENFCAYRAVLDGEDQGCAIGCVLPDKLAKKAGQFELSSITSIFRKNGKSAESIQSWFRNVNFELLVSLQHAHDNSSSTTISNHLKRVAHKFKLKIPTRRSSAGRT